MCAEKVIGIWNKTEGKTHSIADSRAAVERGFTVQITDQMFNDWVRPDLDKLAKPKVQALLRRGGRTAEITITVLSDGEDGVRGVVGWLGRKCEHRMDWFHVSRRLKRIRKQLFQLPSSPVYGCRVASIRET
jgi:hypothetical protein